MYNFLIPTVVYIEQTILFKCNHYYHVKAVSRINMECILIPSMLQQYGDSSFLFSE